MLLASCTDDPKLYSANENFDMLWRTVDEHYCFFEYKNIDWNEVGNRYRAKMKEKDSMTQIEFFDLLAEMLAELQDGHVNLSSSFDTSRYWIWEQYPVNYDERLEDLYLYTPAHNRADKTIEKESRRLFNVVSEQQSTSEQLVDVQDSIAPVAEDVLAEMLRRMKSQSFDSERLSLGKVIVSSSTLTAEQIGQIVATIDFSNSQVELLKYAYSYCKIVWSRRLSCRSLSFAASFPNL